MLCEPRVQRERDDAKKLLKLKKKKKYVKMQIPIERAFYVESQTNTTLSYTDPTPSSPPSLITDSSSVSVLGFAGQEGPGGFHDRRELGNRRVYAGRDEHDRRRTRCTRRACNTVQMFVKEGRCGGGGEIGKKDRVRGKKITSRPLCA